MQQMPIVFQRQYHNLFPDGTESIGNFEIQQKCKQYSKNGKALTSNLGGNFRKQNFCQGVIVPMTQLNMK